ncbi:MAG: DUF2851 family protein [Calditrichaeota bacterium]|nr:MAG: DUF2851 family protein [Calditrichota bacterium]MBL1206293.1 DUF2851 family protein [Calditrichota bacterium]NOG46119.1 DUF2851 family protein [Calditrichota bacterium]
MQETNLYRFWEYYAATDQILSWGQSTLKIISSGRLNEHEGPDYQGARFELNGVLFHGAVEMHISLNDWYGHQHHYNPAYREVQLHVLLNEPGCDESTRHVQLSEAIPIFVLPVPQAYLKKNIQTNCRAAKKPQNIKKNLQQLAINRLQYKMHAFRKKLENHSVHQLFYQAYLRALGYPYNKHVFEWLALRVSAEQVNKYRKSPLQLLAMYMGLAGFLDSDFKDSFALSLKRIFNQLSLSLPFAALSQANWQFAAVRPLNHPQFRLAGWVALISRYQTDSLFDFFYSLIEQRLPYPDLLSQLEEYLSLKTDSYWQEHYALEKPVKNHTNKFYLGRQRIKEIIVNLLIPLHLSHAQQKGNIGFVSYLEDFYLYIPGTCTYKSIYRQKPWLKYYISYWPSFTLGQAFIELDESYCRVSKCDRCPLGRVQQML